MTPSPVRVAGVLYVGHVTVSDGFAYDTPAVGPHTALDAVGRRVVGQANAQTSPASDAGAPDSADGLTGAGGAVARCCRATAGRRQLRRSSPAWWESHGRQRQSHKIAAAATIKDTPLSTVLAETSHNRPNGMAAKMSRVRQGSPRPPAMAQARIGSMRTAS